MKTNEMMSQEEVVKVLNDTEGFLEDSLGLCLKMIGVDCIKSSDLEDKDNVETLRLFKKGLMLYSDLIKMYKTLTISMIDTNQKVNQMYEALLKSKQIEK